MIFCQYTLMETDPISGIKKKIRKLSRKARENLNLQEEYDRLEEEYDRLEEEYDRLEEEEGEEVNKMILELKQLQTGRMRRETVNAINNNKGKLDQLYKTIIDEIHTEQRRIRREQRRIKTEQHLEQRRIKEEQRRIKAEKDALPDLEEMDLTHILETRSKPKYASSSSSEISNEISSSDISTSPELSSRSNSRTRAKGGKWKNNKTKKHKK